MDTFYAFTAKKLSSSFLTSLPERNKMKLTIRKIKEYENRIEYSIRRMWAIFYCGTLPEKEGATTNFEQGVGAPHPVPSSKLGNVIGQDLSCRRYQFRDLVYVQMQIS